MSSTIEYPGVDQAVQNLDAIYAQRFLDKLAEYGYMPETDEAKIAALHTGAQLDEQPEFEQPQSQPTEDPFVAANVKLASVLGQRGGAEKQAESERAHLAIMLAQEPEFYKSAVALAKHMSEADDQE